MAVTIIMYFISKILLNPKFQDIAKKFMKQGFVTFLMFNIFNISYSAGLHWKYADPETEGYFFSSVVLYSILGFAVLSIIAI